MLKCQWLITTTIFFQSPCIFAHAILLFLVSNGKIPCTPSACDSVRPDFLYIVCNVLMWAWGCVLFPQSLAMAAGSMHILVLLRERWLTHSPFFDACTDMAMIKGKNCVGTVLGFSNSLLSVGQTIGPVIAAMIYKSAGAAWVYMYLAGT